jgi:hypothetical protein
LFNVKIEAMKYNTAQKEILPIPLDDKAYYAALCALDACFDSRLFIGVTYATTNLGNSLKVRQLSKKNG